MNYSQPKKPIDQLMKKKLLQNWTSRGGEAKLQSSFSAEKQQQSRPFNSQGRYAFSHHRNGIYVRHA